MWKDAEKFLLKDKYIAPLINKYGHCGLKSRSRDYYFEDLVDAIIQQQLSMKSASAIFNRVKVIVEQKRDLSDGGKQKVKSSLKHKWREDVTKNVNINPENIQALSDEELRICGLSLAKVVYVKDLAERVIHDRLRLLSLDELNNEEIMTELIAVKGVGEWTAHMFLMFTLGRPDIFPVGDLGLRNAFDKVIKKGLDKKQMDKFALRWKPYRTIASWYIWKTLESN